MAKSCKEVAQSLIDCMQKTECMKKGGDLRTCMKAHEVRNADGSADVTGGECQELRTAYFNCKRGSLDMRSRIRGQRVY
mgnify:CR=1 FL=1